MPDRWLGSETRQTLSELLEVRRVSADVEAEDQELEEWLGHELMRNYLDPKKRAGLSGCFHGAVAFGGFL